MLIRFSFLPALSIHQLAAQGEMVFLASRIEQGGWNYDKFFKNHTIYQKGTITIWKYMFIILSFQTETVINLQDEEGFTPLMWAAAHGQIAVVEFLLQNVSISRLIAMFLFFFVKLVLLKCIFFPQGADPNLLAKGRESALSLACSKGYTDIVKMLIDCGVDVNEYDWVRRCAVCDGIKYDNLGLMSKYWETCKWCLNIVVVLFLWLLIRTVEPLCCMQFMGTMCAVWKYCWVSLWPWNMCLPACLHAAIFRKCVWSVKVLLRLCVFQKAALIRPLSPILGSTQWTWLWPWAIEMVCADHRHSTFGNEIWNAGKTHQLKWEKFYVLFLSVQQVMEAHLLKLLMGIRE